MRAQETANADLHFSVPFSISVFHLSNYKNKETSNEIESKFNMDTTVTKVQSTYEIHRFSAASMTQSTVRH